MTQRTLAQKTEDIKRTYTQFEELITTPEQSDMLDKMVGSDARAALALSGADPSVYASVVRSAIDLWSIIAANNRTALLAAVQANAGSPARTPAEE